MPQSEAQKKATAKYQAKNYASITVKAKKETIQEFKNYAEKNNISARKFAYNAMLYCIENNITFNEKDE